MIKPDRVLAMFVRPSRPDNNPVRVSSSRVGVESDRGDWTPPHRHKQPPSFPSLLSTIPARSSTPTHTQTDDPAREIYTATTTRTTTRDLLLGWASCLCGLLVYVSQGWRGLEEADGTAAAATGQGRVPAAAVQETSDATAQFTHLLASPSRPGRHRVMHGTSDGGGGEAGDVGNVRETGWRGRRRGGVSDVFPPTRNTMRESDPQTRTDCRKDMKTRTDGLQQGRNETTDELC